MSLDRWNLDRWDSDNIGSLGRMALLVISGELEAEGPLSAVSVHVIEELGRLLMVGSFTRKTGRVTIESLFRKELITVQVEVDASDLSGFISLDAFQIGRLLYEAALSEIAPSSSVLDQFDP